MNTNEEQACGACGENASAHPVDGPNGLMKCGVCVEPHPVQAEPSPRELVAAIALDGRISLTPEAASLLGVVRGGHTVFDLIDRALDIAKHRDQLKAQVEQERARGRSERDEAERAAHTDGEHRAKWSSSFRDIVVELFPDSADDVMQAPLEDAVTTCLERIKSLRRGEQEIVKASMEIAERSRQIARALDVSAATPWDDLVTAVAIRAAAFLRLPDVESARDEAFRMRDEAIAKLEALTVRRNRPLRALCIDCHDVFNITQNRCARCEDAVRAAPEVKAPGFYPPRPELEQPTLGPLDALEQLGAALGYGGKELSGRTWDSLLADVREGDNAYEEQMRMELADALGLTRDPDEAPSWVELLGRVAALRILSNDRGAQLAEIKAELVATHGKVEVQPKVMPRPSQVQQDQLTAFGERLDALSRDLATHTHYSKIDPQELDALEARLDVLAETHERWKSTVDALSARVTELHKHHENNAVEAQRRDQAITERVDALEAWQRAATERLGDPTQPTPDPWSKAPSSETNRARPGEGQFVHLQDLQVGDWIALDGVPREVIWLSPEAVVVGLDGVRRVHLDRSGPALRLIWRPSAKEHRRG